MHGADFDLWLVGLLVSGSLGLYLLVARLPPRMAEIARGLGTGLLCLSLFALFVRGPLRTAPLWDVVIPLGACLLAIGGTTAALLSPRRRSSTAAALVGLAGTMALLPLLAGSPLLALGLAGFGGLLAVLDRRMASDEQEAEESLVATGPPPHQLLACLAWGGLSLMLLSEMALLQPLPMSGVAVNADSPSSAAAAAAFFGHEWLADNGPTWIALACLGLTVASLCQVAACNTVERR